MVDMKRSLGSGDDRRIAGIVGLDAIGPQPPERIEVVAHDTILQGGSGVLDLLSPAGRGRFAEALTGAVDRELTVPTGIAEGVGHVCIAQTLPDVQDRARPRSGSGSDATAPATRCHSSAASTAALTPSATSSAGSRCAATPGRGMKAPGLAARCLASRLVAMP